MDLLLKKKIDLPIFDCHTHLLPGLDDGASSWDEAEQLVLDAWNQGVRAILLTPHYLPGSYQASPEVIREQIQELDRRLSGREKPILLPGCEAYLMPELPELVRRGEVMTLADRGTHVLVELPLGELPRWADQVLFELALAGVTPILAHPERSAGIQRHPEWLKAAVDRGVMVQVNTKSLEGEYGSAVKKSAWSLARRKLLHFIGSDAHCRGVGIKEVMLRLARTIGEDLFREVSWNNPCRLYLQESKV